MLRRVTPEPPTIERLAEIRCPTTVIVGENDTKDSIAQSKILAEKIQGSTTIICPETGHFVNMEVPGIVNKSLLKSEIKVESDQHL